MYIKLLFLVASVFISLFLFTWYFEVYAREGNLLGQSWKLSSVNGSAEAYQPVEADLLLEKLAISITYNLHGMCLLPGNASAIIFDQQGWKYTSLADYGKNCLDGEQTVTIPLHDFKDINTGQALDPSKPLNGSFHVRFWSEQQFTLEILSVTLLHKEGVEKNDLKGLYSGQAVSGLIQVSFDAESSKTASVRFYINGSLKSVETVSPYYLGGDDLGSPLGFDTRQLIDGDHTLMVEHQLKDQTTATYEYTFFVSNDLMPITLPTPSPLPTPLIPSPTSTPTPVPPTSTWSIRSIDAMKDTKDAICSQRSDEWIGKWVDKAVEIGANYVAISIPYDNPSCGSADAYTKRWIRAIRARGLSVWHRQMPLSFEGIYSVNKTRNDYLTQIATYIKKNADNYAPGDIFTPIPEPQNGGIAGITYCAYGVCQWDTKEAFNLWLREAIAVSRSAFNSINKTDMKIGYYGFDGFVAWGANNPDWNGILEDETIEAMGNITIDHYPELIGTDMATDIADLEARYPGVDIIIGEWGTVNGGDTTATARKTMGALVRPSVKGFNYWQFGPHGAGEQLINDDFSNRPHFAEVQSFYKR
jgi:hypothetical protein